MQVVWPGVAVTDDSLVQCIHEIRCALGDEKHAVLKTVPKRGYRLNLATKAAPGASTSHSPGRVTHIAITPAFIAGIAALALIAIGAIYGFMQWRDQTSGLPLPEKPSIAERVPSSDMPRIAILPFDDNSTGADKGYLSDAVAEGIITELARSKTYAVIARNSSFKYRGKPTDAQADWR